MNYFKGENLTKLLDVTAGVLSVLFLFLLLQSIFTIVGTTTKGVVVTWWDAIRSLLYFVLFYFSVDRLKTLHYKYK